MRSKALFLVGPTAVGKTEIAMEIASRCNGEIIGADAFQIYQGLDLLAAKPSVADRKKVQHHLVDFVPLSQKFDVGQYLAAARSCADEICSRKKLPIFVGGTGLYIRALSRGLSELPGADADIRERLEIATLDELQNQYAALDPEGASRIDLKNKRRLIRAIEVCLLTGKPFSAFRKEWTTIPEPVAGFFLTRDRDDLYRRISARVTEMFRDGVAKEVRDATDIGDTAGQAIGLKEIRAFLNGELTENECIEQVQQSTRRYAKRQLTWFRGEAAGFQQVNLSTTSELKSVIDLIEQKVRLAFPSVHRK